MDQITIYDLLEDDPIVSDFLGMTIEEIAGYIGEKIGLTFEYNSFFDEYQARYKGIIFDLNLSTYSATGIPFISVGYENKKEHSGGGRPCDSIEEAIRYFKNKIGG